MTRKTLKLVAPVGVLLLAGAIAAVLAATRPELAPDEARERDWLVTAAEVEIGSVQPELKLFGEIAAGREVELRALVSGQVIETGPDFREGGFVEAGHTLLKIDPFDYTSALSERRAQTAEAVARLAEFEARRKQEQDLLDSAREQLAIRERDFERATELAKKGNISGRVLDDRAMLVSQITQSVKTRINNLAVESAKIAQQEAAVARLRVGIERAQRDLHNTRLVAPFAGYVRSVTAQIGKHVGPNDRVATLIEAQGLEARFTLSDAQFGRIIAAEGNLTGRAARVVWQVGGKPLSFQAQIERVGARIAANSGGVEVFAKLQTDGLAAPIRAGAFVEIYIPDRSYEDVARLPEAAIFDRNRVYVIRDGRLEPREVTVAAYAGDDVLVQGDLRAGERVLTTRFAQVGAGVRAHTEPPR